MEVNLSLKLCFTCRWYKAQCNEQFSSIPVLGMAGILTSFLLFLLLAIVDDSGHI
jgi:hypothetical protein